MRQRSIIVLAVVAALAAGCGWRDETAASVGRAEVSMSQLRDEVHALAEHPDLAAAFRVDLQSDLGLAPTDRAATLVSWLNRRITDLAIEEELGRRGITLDASDLAAADEELRFQLQLTGQQTGSSPAAQFDDLPADLRTALARREAGRERLAAELAAEGAEPLPPTGAGWFEANRDDYRELCVSLIQVASEEEADDVARDLAAGADFAALARTSSLDQASAAQGGDGGCAYAGQVTDELAEQLLAAEVGEDLEPIQLLTGWFLFRLTDRSEPRLDDAVRRQAGIDRLNARQQVLSAWISASSPDVSVTPRLGQWDAERFQVTLNPGPARAAGR